MGTDSHKRITELEIQLAHVQRLYEQLNEVVTAQAMEADRMARRMTQLHDQLRQLKAKPLPPADSLDEKPPHY
jgi:uncharacterized coiled-coil protein SlyX